MTDVKITPERITIYEQDIKSLQFCDTQRWNRFQTASAIELAVLYGAFQFQKLAEFERFLLMIFGFLLIICVFVLAFVEEVDAKAFLVRIKDFERHAKVPFPERKRPKELGSRIAYFSMAVIIVFNIVVCVRLYPGA